jgi:hypothetical protein
MATKKGTGAAGAGADWVRGSSAAEIRQQLQEQAIKNALIAKIKDGVIPETGADEKQVLYNNSLFNLTPVDVHNPKNAGKVRARIEEYLTLCEECEVQPTVAHLALAIGLKNRYALRKIAEGADATVSDEISDLIERAYSFMEGMIESRTMTGAIPPAPGIFSLKNHFGYRDQSEVRIDTGVVREESPEKLIAEAQLLGEISVDDDGTGAEEEAAAAEETGTGASVSIDDAE